MQEVTGVIVEFCLDGPPISLQARGRTKSRWKKEVWSEAARQLSGDSATPCSGMVELTITYFHDGDAPDVDNVIKPIADALNGLVYIDDSQVAKASSGKRNINGSFKVRNMSPALAEAFTRGTEFVHVRVEHWADDGRLG